MNTERGVRAYLSWFLAFLVLLASGIAFGRLFFRFDQPHTADLPEIRVAAASDLYAAMPELVEAFEAEQGGQVRVVPVLGSSGQLARQIEQGAPYHVFLSANRDYVRRLSDSGAIMPDSVRPYARGPLVLAFAQSIEIAASGLDALTDPAIRSIALANPDHAPYGMAGRQALQHAGLWDELQPKIVFGQSIQNAAQFVRSGQAEAGLIARSLVPDPSLRWEPVPADLHDPIDQYLGIVADRERLDSAQAFCEFLVSEQGQAILRRFGFEPAGGTLLPEVESD
ncbi:molybdate ABC transporter substrate-binding protein [Tautonia marina]|uniref:molybdate ABC transporter substrate-binding protein n=1 Tax=Tautonia marina TaxID=2653855 RepID=UPI001261195A|nr:molybdate ABC transporter substrate-binding protein [Tautonia marina]